MIDFIDSFGFYNIVFILIIVGFLISYIMNKTQINLLKSRERTEYLKDKLFLSSSIIILLFLFTYSLNSYEELELNLFKNTEHEQIKYLKDHINKIGKRNNNIISSFIILATVVIIYIIPKKKN